MALRKFRSEALRSKYGFLPAYKTAPYIICSSEAEKFLAIFSPALIFPLVLSFVSSQRKERFVQSIISRLMYREVRSFSFAHNRNRNNT